MIFRCIGGVIWFWMFYQFKRQVIEGHHPHAIDLTYGLFGQYKKDSLESTSTQDNHKDSHHGKKAH